VNHAAAFVLRLTVAAMAFPHRFKATNHHELYAVRWLLEQSADAYDS
jgi:hypothetical protein